MRKNEELTALRRHFHAYPELSLEEKETAAYVEHYLRELGLETERVGGNGVVATVYSGCAQDCKTVAIRAEMDAIAVEEKNEFAWKSKHPGIMHACGHDAILAVALVLARRCVEQREKLPVNVKFIFQPAEENGKGTNLMLEGGVMQNPAVDYFIMFHFVNDIPNGLQLQRGESSAVLGAIDIQIRGKSSHWCMSELGIDSINIAGKALQMIENLNQTYPADAPFILGIGKITGGTAKNVIAENTHLEGNLRACTKKDYFKLRELLLEQLDTLGKECGAEIEVYIDDEPVPPILNDDALIDLGIEVGESIWGEDCRLINRHYLSGDSAAFYFDYARGVFFVFTAKKPEEEFYPMHSGKFDFDENVMEKAEQFLWEYLLKLPVE